MNYIKNLLFISILVLNISCNKKPSNIEKWEQFVINPKISENKIYKDLNKEPETFFFADDHNNTLKKSSDVSFYGGKEINLKDDYARHNVCKAYFISDTLVVRIGVETYHGGVGFKINQKNNKFHT